MELGRASMVLGLILWMTEQTQLTSENQLSFTSAIDRIPFIRNNRSSVKGTSMGDNHPEGKKGDYIGGHVRYVQLDTSMAEASAAVSQGKGDKDVHQSLIAAVAASENNISAFASVLIQIEEALMQTIADKNAFQSLQDQVQSLRKLVEEVMFSPQGQLLNEHVLTPFGCQLNWEDESVLPPPKGKSQKTHPSPWTPRLKGNAGFFPPTHPKSEKSEKEKSLSGRFSPPQESEEIGMSDDSGTSPINEVILKLENIKKNLGTDKGNVLSEKAFQMPLIAPSPKSKEYLDGFIRDAKVRKSSTNADLMKISTPIKKSTSTSTPTKIPVTSGGKEMKRGSHSVYSSPSSSSSSPAVSKVITKRNSISANKNNNKNETFQSKSEEEDEQHSIAAAWALSSDSADGPINCPK